MRGCRKLKWSAQSWSPWITWTSSLVNLLLPVSLCVKTSTVGSFSSGCAELNRPHLQPHWYGAAVSREKTSPVHWFCCFVTEPPARKRKSSRKRLFSMISLTWSKTLSAYIMQTAGNTDTVTTTQPLLLLIIIVLIKAFISLSLFTLMRGWHKNNHQRSRDLPACTRCRLVVGGWNSNKLHWQDMTGNHWTHKAEMLRKETHLTEGNVLRTVNKMMSITCADKHTRGVSSCKLVHSFVSWLFVISVNVPGEKDQKLSIKEESWSCVLVLFWRNYVFSSSRHLMRCIKLCILPSQSCKLPVKLWQNAQSALKTAPSEHEIGFSPCQDLELTQQLQQRSHI